MLNFFQWSILKPVSFEKYFSWASSVNAAGPTVSDTFALCAAAPAVSFSEKTKRKLRKSDSQVNKLTYFLIENRKAMRCIRPEVAVLVPNSWFVCRAFAGWSWFDLASWILKLHQILHNLLCFLGILFPDSYICSRSPTVICCCLPDLNLLSSL